MEVLWSSAQQTLLNAICILPWVYKVNWHSSRSIQLLWLAGNTGAVKNVKEFYRAFPGTEWLLWRPSEHPGLQPTRASSWLTCSVKLQQCSSFRGIHIWCDNSNDPFPFSRCFHICYLSIFHTKCPWNTGDSRAKLPLKFNNATLHILETH